MSFLARVMAAAVVLGASTVSLAQVITINPGSDHWRTGSAQVFIGGGVPAIPAGFFGPGSDPFIGTINCVGQPVDAAVSDADTVVQRLTATSLTSPPSVGTVQIEFMALHLRSVNPIMVTGPAPSQWDVSVEIQAHGPGGAQIQRTTPTGGTFGYNNLQWTPRFTFTPVGGGPSLVYAAGALPTSTMAPPPWSVNPPNPLLIPGSGPNFFAQAPMNVQSSGGFQAAWFPAQASDCNANGQIDALDLLEGLAVDNNMNRRLDACETTLVCRQLSFPDLMGGFVQRFSGWAEVGVRTVEPPNGTVLWFNAVVNGQWAVRNMPLIEIDGQGGLHTYKVYVALGATGAQTGASILGLVTTDQQPAPPVGSPTIVPVTELVYNPAGRSLQTAPMIPGAPTLFINPLTGFTWTSEHRPGMDGVNEAKDGCAPGAAGRSMDWMNDMYCLNLPADCDTAQELYAKLFMLMMTSSPGGTSDANNVAGIQALINQKMLQNSLSVMINLGADGQDIADAIAQGKDVMGLIGWLNAMGQPNGGHVITITGVTICGPFVTIHYRDDAPQGDGNADTDDTKTAGLSGGTLTGLASNTFDGIITICPTPLKQLDALTKWIYGDGAGGMTAGVGPLLDSVIGAGAPTAAQLAQLKLWLARARTIARYLHAQLAANPNTPPHVLAAALDLKNRLDAAWASLMAYMTTRDPAHLAAARAQINATFQNDTFVIDAFLDCNGNDVDDSVDIKNGTSLDSNRNGRPDECEVVYIGRQLSFPTFANTFVQRFSDSGTLGISYVEPPEDTILWFNASVNGTWVIQNLPLGEVDGEGDLERMFVNFKLDVLPGTPLLTLPLVARITLDQQTTIPTGTPLVISLTEKIVRPGYIDPSQITEPIGAPVAEYFLNPADLIPWERIRRRNVDSVEEVVDGCAPGAGGRCLDWMNDLYCLGFPADCDTAQEIYAKLYMLMDTQPRVGTTPGGTDLPDMGQGLRDLIAMKGLSASLMVSLESALDPNYMATRLKQGKDVMALIYWLKANGMRNGGHAITITGMTICGDKVEIEYVDDATGGDAQGDGSADGGTKTAMLMPRAGGGYSIGGLPRNELAFFFQICPSEHIINKALTKWVDGDGPSGMTEGVGPLIARILGGHMPTIAEKGNLRKWACNAKDVAGYLSESINNSNAPQSIKDAAERLKAAAAAMKAAVENYIKQNMDPTFLGAAQAQIGTQFHNDLGIVRLYYDCNNNGIDDLADLASGVLHDANHDQRPDQCQCLADWNADGNRNVTDIFAFLTSWFAGDADFNHDGLTTVADIFAFLTAWFGGC